MTTRCRVRSPEVTAAARRDVRSTRYSCEVPLTPVSKYRARPSADHRRPLGIRSKVSAAGFDAASPDAGASQILGCDFSGTALTNAIVDPSGDQRGELSPS